MSCWGAGTFRQRTGKWTKTNAVNTLHYYYYLRSVWHLCVNLHTRIHILMVNWFAQSTAGAMATMGRLFEFSAYIQRSSGLKSFLKAIKQRHSCPSLSLSITECICMCVFVCIGVSLYANACLLDCVYNISWDISKAALVIVAQPISVINRVS